MVSNRKTFYMSSLQGGCGKSLNDEMGVYAAERRHHNKPVRMPSNLGDFFVQSRAKRQALATPVNAAVDAAKASRGWNLQDGVTCASLPDFRQSMP